MKEISSKDNRIIKDAASLSEKKKRDEKGMFMIEGPNLLREALDEDMRIQSVFVLAGSETPEIMELVQQAEISGCQVYAVSRDAFMRVAQTDTPQAVIAVCAKKRFSEEDFFGEKGSNILVLDRIQDPGNMGTLLRTADAAGFSGVMLIKGSADPFAPKVVRAAAGSLFRMPLKTGLSPQEAADQLKKHGKNPAAAAMDAESAYYDEDLSENFALIVGNEGNGVSDELMSLARRISIPMAGRTESLNAALAGGIIMFEALRQKTIKKR